MNKISVDVTIVYRWYDRTGAEGRVILEVPNSCSSSKFEGNKMTLVRPVAAGLVLKYRRDSAMVTRVTRLKKYRI